MRKYILPNLSKLAFPIWIPRFPIQHHKGQRTSKNNSSFYTCDGSALDITRNSDSVVFGFSSPPFPPDRIQSTLRGPDSGRTSGSLTFWLELGIHRRRQIRSAIKWAPVGTPIKRAYQVNMLTFSHSCRKVKIVNIVPT